MGQFLLLDVIRPMPAATPSSFYARMRHKLADRSVDQIASAAYQTIAQKLRRMSPAARAAARVDAAFDTQWGTDTGREVTMSDLDFPADLRRSSHHYQPSGAHVLEQAIDCAGIDPAQFTFVDLGCGKGRVVLLAAARGFIAAIGVEYSSLLSGIAQANAARFVARGGATLPPVFWQGNAADYPAPDGNVFVYLYNSFGADILMGCLDRLEAAKRADPARRIVLAYVNPQHADVVASRTAWRAGTTGDDIRSFECGGVG